MNSIDAKKPATPAEGPKMQQSTIGFPYGDLEDAISVAAAVMKLGGVPCEPDQLAAALNQTPTSGSFRMKIHTARTFGVISTVQGRYQLTDLGFALTDRVQERAARADAFLNVPLYRRTYDEYRNRQLPPSPPALERAFVSFGVVPKQAERARQAFLRSAQQAGFFDHGSRDRLVRPPVGGSTSAPSEVTTDEAVEIEGVEQPRTPPVGGGGGNHRPPSGLPPFIQGLLDTLPEPGTNWAVEGRLKWLQAAANIFDLMYKGDGTITMTANLETARATER